MPLTNETVTLNPCYGWFGIDLAMFAQCDESYFCNLDYFRMVWFNIYVDWLPVRLV